MSVSLFSLHNMIKRSLRFKIIATLFLCATVLSLLTISFIVFSQNRQYQQDLAQNTDRIIDRLAFTMALPLWNFDTTYLQRLADEELASPLVVSVFISSQDKSLKIGRHKVASAKNEVQIESFLEHLDATVSELHHEKTIVFEGVTIGTIHLTVTDAANMSQLVSLIFQQTAQSFVLLAGLSFMAYLSISRLALTPLAKLHEATQRFSQGDLTARVNVVSADEIGLLAATLNTMAEQLSSTINDLQQVKKNLLSSNRQLHDIIEFIPDPLLVIDSRGLVVTWNLAIAELTGIPAAKMIGRGDQEYALPFYEERRALLIDLLDLPEDSLKSHYQSVQKKGHKLLGANWCLLPKDQRNHYLLGIAAPLYDSDGARCGAIEIIRDQTEQKQAELALQESVSFRERIFNSSRIPIIIMDAELLTFIDCNPAATAIYHLETRENTLGKTPLDVSAPTQYDGSNSADQARQYIEEACKKGQIVFEWRHQRPEGEIWDAEVHLMSFQSGDRSFLQFTLQDITERKKTTALMMQTEKMMMVGGLAAGMAHEINNPLGIITQTAQIIQRRLDPALPANQSVAAACGLDLDSLRQYLNERQINEFVVNIRTATERAAKIIVSMLKFSRKSESLTELVDLSQLVEQSLLLAATDYDLKKKYDFKEIAIIREFAPNLPLVPIMAMEIEQTLLNLLKNAAQALRIGQTQAPQITVRTHRDDNFVVVEIEDNGPGIPLDIQKRIFEPFFTTKPVGQGTGLGLSISYAIITTNHHGRIAVRSAPGAGACFTIHLPLAAATPSLPGETA